MSKTNRKVKLAEIVPRNREDVADDYKRMIAQIVEERVAEAMANASDATFQPFFQSRQVANAIRRRQTVTELNKFPNAFADYGCLSCHSKQEAHHSLWMCKTCYRRAFQQLRMSMRKHGPEPRQPQQTFTDTVQLARAALAPSIMALSAKNPHENAEAPVQPIYRGQKEAAKAAGISQPTLSDWVKSGRVQLPEKKFRDNMYLWTEEDIERLKKLKAENRGQE